MNLILFLLSLPTGLGALLTYWGGCGLLWANERFVAATRWILGWQRPAPLNRRRSGS